MFNSNTIKCSISVSYSYCPVTFNTIIYIKPIDETHILLNDILEGLSKSISLNNFSISYCEFDNETNIYVYIGKYPLNKNYLIGYDSQSLVNNNIATNIRIKLRQIVSKEFPLKQELVEDDI